jgi:membrane protease YdiL (CAAX protease family)
MRWDAMHWDYALIFVFLVGVVPLMGRWRVERILRGPETTGVDRLRLYASTVAFQWILVAIIVWRTGVHGMSAAALGLAAPKPTLTIFVSAGLVMLALANQFVSLRHIGARPEELHSKLARVALRIFPQDRFERLIFFGVVATVAICEELIYRGFLQGLFVQLTGINWCAVLVAAAMFAVAHLYQGKRGLIATFIVGVVFSMARAATGSLIPGVAAHFAIDLAAGYVLPGRLQRALAAASMSADSSA